jgi:hypothetical protein
MILCDYMSKNNFKLFLFIFLFFPVTSFAEDYLKHIMTSVTIVVTNQNKFYYIIF